MEAFETRSKKQNGSYVTSSDPGEERHVPYEAASRSGVESPTRGPWPVRGRSSAASWGIQSCLREGPAVTPA